MHGRNITRKMTKPLYFLPYTGITGKKTNNNIYKKIMHGRNITRKMTKPLYFLPYTGITEKTQKQ